MQLQTTTLHDQDVIARWINRQHAEHTKRAYQHDIHEMMCYVNKPLQMITLLDLEDYADQLSGEASTRARKLHAIRSLFSYAFSIGYLHFDVAHALKLPKVNSKLAERILSEEDIQKIIAAETNPRNQIMLKLLYHTGLRVSELVSLRWEQIIKRTDGGQLSIVGKGEQVRQVLISQRMYNLLISMKTNTPYIFTSRKTKGPLTTRQVERIVEEATRKAGIDQDVSPHWFRHANASHALANGAPLPVVRDNHGHSSLAITSVYIHARPDDGTCHYLKDDKCKSHHDLVDICASYPLD